MIRSHVDVDSGTDAGPEDGWPESARCVAHVDLDCFYAAVEELQYPEVRGRPLAVVMGLDAEGHGVVATASYPARAFGVHSAQPLSQARRLCPELIVLPVRHDLYEQYSMQVMAVLHGLTSRVQQVSIDEAFLELTGQARPLRVLEDAAQRIRGEIGLSCSLGVATSRQVAKIATDRGKPCGFTVVPPASEESFLAPLPIEVLWGVGPRTAQRLHALGLGRLGELAAIDPSDLSPHFGPRRALELHRGALGLDDSPLNLDRRAQSLSTERTFARAQRSPRELWFLLQQMAAELAQRLQQHNLVSRTIGIKLRYADWRLLTRDRTLDQGIDDGKRIADVAAELMRAHWQRGSALRLLGLRASGLANRPEAAQLRLFDSTPK